MKQIIFRPEIERFDTCREFVREFCLDEQDLILTNEFIYRPYFGELSIKATVVFQEQYGAGEPSDEMVESILRDADLSCFRRVIGIGGGTVMDIAKVLAVAGEAKLDPLYEQAPNFTRLRELVLIPTTCGTGSEVTNIAVFARTRLGVKMGLVSDSMYASSAVMIPELLSGLPFSVFASASIDALVHAVESILSPKATSYTKLFGYEAVKMILKGYQRIAAEGKDARKELFGDFLTAANYAGLSFGTAGCAAVHALSYPLGSMYHVPHGESNYAIFMGVMRAYLELGEEGELHRLGIFMADVLGCPESDVWNHLETLLEQILPLKPLCDYGVTEEDLSRFTESVMTTQGRLMANNFTGLNGECVLGIYRGLWKREP